MSLASAMYAYAKKASFMLLARCDTPSVHNLRTVRPCPQVFGTVTVQNTLLCSELESLVCQHGNMSCVSVLTQSAGETSLY